MENIPTVTLYTPRGDYLSASIEIAIDETPFELAEGEDLVLALGKNFDSKPVVTKKVSDDSMELNEDTLIITLLNDDTVDLTIGQTYVGEVTWKKANDVNVTIFYVTLTITPNLSNKEV